MDGSSRDPNANRDESPCGAGGVHGWESRCWRIGNTGRRPTEAALRLLVSLADRLGLSSEFGSLLAAAKLVEAERRSS